ncbi:hypothetical protein [Candidatus Vampirococcus lugosii]|uniref:Magnesium transporter MgtE intracellular domain-containing protein n=1 Tax=Candidatus Vampirococcus lugosii TaxID=2789015 RepID=A0ABS5QKF9_9BACT|nr:hypothetical protein [Candidatus Vampirococcus lugosii]MBS8121668.1 hypothetical protein [Candidatus Vampirococcus lugosii]
MNNYEKKQKIIEILEKDEDKKIYNFFVKNIDKISDEDIDDIYTSFTTDDKNKINEIIKKDNEKLSELILKLEEIDTKIIKKILQHKEENESQEDMENIENLFDKI